MKNNPTINGFLRSIAIFGNMVYVLWILYNGINEGFRANLVSIVSYVGLICLLILNIYLLSKRQRKT